ncbi:MAG: FtsX-like permease family protein [bacterium]
MIIPKLALRNLLGAGLRTWLNVVVLSLTFVAIILSLGFNQGILEQASRTMIDSEIGGGQYWQEAYDPYDPFALEDAHAQIPAAVKNLMDQEQAAGILITQGTIYPEGRILPVLLKGIDPAQKTLDIPSQFLSAEEEEIPALIGSRMAANANLNIGDYVTLRWRDANGTFDARDAVIVQIMNTSLQTIDSRQIWLPLHTLQQMTGMVGEATIIVVDRTVAAPPEIQGWEFRDLDFLLKDLRDLVRTRLIARSILYVILLFLAVIAIFNAQVLAIFRRRKEIGTLMSLGMTRAKVIQLFTLEGGLTGVLAAVIGAIYGVPLLSYFAVAGMAMPQGTENFGLSIGHTLYPSYGLVLVLGTTLVVLLTVTVVSYLPTRRIAKLKPTDALRGKLP